MRVMVTMYLLPRPNHGRWRGNTLEGCVLYADGTEKRVGADEIDAGFRKRAAAVMRQITSDAPTKYVSSAGECGRWMLTDDDCSERIG